MEYYHKMPGRGAGKSYGNPEDIYLLLQLHYNNFCPSTLIYVIMLGKAARLINYIRRWVATSSRKKALQN